MSGFATNLNLFGGIQQMANEREQLEQQIRDLEAQKVTLFDSGSADQVEVGRLNEKIKLAQQQLSEIESQQTLETTAQEIASGMETYNIGDSSFTLDQLAADEDAAKILRKGIAENSQKQAQKWHEDINAQKAVYEAKVSSLTAQLADADKAIDELQSENSQLQVEKDDLAEKRDNAVRISEEYQADVARLNARVDELTQQLATTASVSNVVEITSDSDLEAAAQRLKAKKESEALAKKQADDAAKTRIYNVHQVDGTGAKFGAHRADNDEYLTFGWLERNQYVEISNEEVQRFREEAAQAAQAELESIPSNDETNEPVNTPLPFPEVPHADTGHGVDEDIPERQDGTNGGGGVATVEDRLAALELHCFGQVRLVA